METTPFAVAVEVGVRDAKGDAPPTAKPQAVLMREARERIEEERFHYLRNFIQKQIDATHAALIAKSTTIDKTRVVVSSTGMDIMLKDREHWLKLRAHFNKQYFKTIEQSTGQNAGTTYEWVFWPMTLTEQKAWEEEIENGACIDLTSAERRKQLERDIESQKWGCAIL